MENPLGEWEVQVDTTLTISGTPKELKTNNGNVALTFSQVASFSNIKSNTYLLLKVIHNKGNYDLIYNTRNVTNKAFRLSKINKSLFKQSIEYLGPKYFNQIPADIIK